MLILYNFFIALYILVARLAALVNPKAREWIRGRSHWTKTLEEYVDKGSSWIWVHCASAGEFEQGKPLIEKIKETFPGHKILVTFFSPSGFKVGKKYTNADHICYLPTDTKQNADQFLRIVNPKLVVFVKYDYWYHHLHAVKQQQIPLLLISAIFRNSQPFFKWYGGLHRKMLGFFTQLFVQDYASKDLLASIGITHCTISGDTRFDRVAAISQSSASLEWIEAFTANKKVLIAGSTWPEDEEMINVAVEGNKELMLIIAPHEINPSHISSLMRLFPQALKYSELGNKDLSGSSILIIDNVGMLSRLYEYAHITYIGGGFNKSGIHNTLEAAVWGKPVLFGPNYNKFKEARDLIEKKAAFTLSTAAMLKETLQQLMNNEILYQQSADAARYYVMEQTGATNKIITYIQENRLLTK